MQFGIGMTTAMTAAELYGDCYKGAAGGGTNVGRSVQRSKPARLVTGGFGHSLPRLRNKSRQAGSGPIKQRW